jgi:hypothetical protein
MDEDIYKASNTSLCLPGKGGILHLYNLEQVTRIITDVITEQSSLSGRP